MTDEQLAEIRQRLEAITKGTEPAPRWFFDSYCHVCCVGSGEPDEGFANGHEPGIVCEVPPAHGSTASTQGQADAQFIAHAPADMTELLGEVDRLRAMLHHELSMACEQEGCGECAGCAYAAAYWREIEQRDNSEDT